MGYTLKDPVRKMKKATRFVGDSSHENLMRVHLAADGSIQSTDAYRVFRMEKGWSGGSDVDIPADIAKRMSRCKVGGNGTAEITQRDGSVAVKMGDGSEFVGECDFRWGFPKLDHFFEPKTQTTVRVLKSDLLEAARGYKRLKAEKMLFEVKGGRFLTRAYGDGWDGKRDFPNAEVEGRDIAIGFNPKFIVDALNSMGDELTVEIEDSFKPAIIRDAALWEELSVSVVTMPIRLGAKDYEVMKDEKKEKKMETETAAETAAEPVEPPKAPKPAPKPETEKPEVKAPKVEETAAVEITVEKIREMFEGEGIAVNQAREGACIWVNGNLKGRRKELKELGFKQGNSKKFGKGMWVKPQA